MRTASDYIEMNVPAKPDYVGVVRLTISGLANRMGFAFDEIEDIKIAVSEAVTNVVNHAYADEDKGQVRIGCNIFDDRIEITVVDQGKSFDVDTISKNLGPVDGKSVDQLNEGGLGLFLIDTLMDKVEISSEAGVVVMMTKYLHRDEVEEHVDRISPAPSQ
ncbi:MULTISPECIES: anti-sigma B factor RsbW [Fictibacillus]|jgi:serine/threonine-protein kinase RsbW|uniref:Serine-protein kinase RsbW n=1 Tax=Fictibacillus arsenicus TaxID=255247 RepID=A0A1V3FZC0_9BACL|nr:MULTISPECIES: anti-sigma B factor RsbW [Fictibacillus]OOE07037.1 anti-sigma B factor RsbW [Fictibacillus arsenicus]RZT14488.1 serine/threonine-protein kinase RsbW [Fictibacillus sp. BK138]